MDVELNEAQVAYAQAILECGLIELESFKEWLATLKECPADLGEALSAQSLINEFELTNRLSKHLGLNVANEIELEMFAAPHPMIPREACAELLFVPLSDQTTTPLPIACCNPLDEVGLDYIRELIGGGELKVSLSAPSQIRAEITACYGTEEEWREYLISQGLTPTDETTNDDFKLEDEQTSQGLSIDTSSRPRTIPDWSHHCERSEARVIALNALFDRG